MGTDIVLTFQGGKRLQITIPATAGNVIYNCSPASKERYMIVSGIITLVADANAANRVIRLIRTDGTNITGEICKTASITAGLTGVLNFGEGGVVQGAVLGGVSGSVNNYLSLVRPIVIEEADQFRVVIGAGLAGDSFSGYIIAFELS